MSLQVTIKVSGLTETQKRFVRMSRDFHDFRDAMKRIGVEGSQYFGSVAWNSQGGVYGARWQSLSTRYAQRKAKQYPGRGILEKSGGMKHAFDYTDLSKDGVVLTNLAPQFKYHQSTAPRTKIPRRQMIGVSTGLKSIIRNAIHDDVTKKLRAK